jgi:small subunit ribosomal protein S19
MKRSKWKGPSISQEFDLNSIGKKHYQHIKISRNLEITPNFVGLRFKVYSGKTFTELEVTNEMIGYKFGEFSPTRSKFVFKKKKKKK